MAVNPERDGMATLCALLPASDALSSYRVVDPAGPGHGSRRPPRDGRPPSRPDGRPGHRAAHRRPPRPTLTQTRTTPRRRPPRTPRPADRGGRPCRCRQPVNPGKPLIQIVIPHDTLTGAAEHPGRTRRLRTRSPHRWPGRSPPTAIWKRLVTDPLSGALLDHGRTTYRPPAALADFVRARDVHCRQPICRRRAIDSELDHTIAYAGDGGHTAEHNCTAPAPTTITSSTTPRDGR